MILNLHVGKISEKDILVDIRRLFTDHFTANDVSTLELSFALKIIFFTTRQEKARYL